MAVTRLLLVTGEVLHESDKECIKSDILAGLSNLPPDIIQPALENLSLPSQSVTNALDAGILLERTSSSFTLRLACRPSGTELASLLTTLFDPPTKPEDMLNVVLVYGGLLEHGTGHWILPDFVFTPTAFLHQLELLNLSQPKAIGVNGQQLLGRVHVHIAVHGIPSGGEWRQLLSRCSDLLNDRIIQLTVNTIRAQTKQNLYDNVDLSRKLSAFDEILQSMWMELPGVYCARLQKPLMIRNPTEPSLRVPRLSVYIFPEGSGQSSILTLPGYGMLINTGFSHSPNCWPVLSCLERLDSVFITHWGVDNILGMLAVFPYAFEPATSSGDSGDSTLCILAPPPFPLRVDTYSEPSTDATPLLLNIPRLVSTLLGDLKQSGVTLNLHTLSRGTNIGSPPHPIRLYQKVGQGTLEAHILTPGDDDTTELRNTIDNWVKASPFLTSTSVGLGKSVSASKVFVPLLSYMSASALIVWRPARETEPISRILLVSPNAHQTRILLSLEAVVATNIFLRHQRASVADFNLKHSSFQASKHSHGSSVKSKNSGALVKTTLRLAANPPQPLQNLATSHKHAEQKTTMKPPFGWSASSECATSSQSLGTHTTVTKRSFPAACKATATTRTLHHPDALQHPSTAEFQPGCTEASSYAVTNFGIMLPPYDKIKPLYVDVSFLPGGGNPSLVDAEWFKRVRARFYVVTVPDPSVRLLESMLYGKEAWTGQDSKLASSVIFACESEELLVWLGRNSSRLSACSMDVAAIASRSNIQLVREQLPAVGPPVSAQTLSCVGYRIDI